MNEAFSKFNLSGKTALVTGGATGIGYYIARGLMRSSATVMLAARREDVLKEGAAKLRSESQTGAVLYRCVDLAQRASIRALASHTSEAMGGVDIFVGNAAQNLLEPINQASDQVIDQSFQINISANIELMRAFLPRMRGKKWGRIIFSASGSSIKAPAQGGMGVYSTTKAALNALTRTAAAESGHNGITVNSLILGVFTTTMLDEVVASIEKNHSATAAKAFIDSFASMTALGRLARCDEVEGVIQLLASDAGSYITGSSLAIDGGLTTMLRPNAPPAEPVYPNNI